MIEYPNALNTGYNRAYGPADPEKFKFVLILSSKGIRIVEVKNIRHETKHSPKYIINEGVDDIKIPMLYNGGFSDSARIGVYDDETLMMKDAKNYYDKRAKLLADYKRNYDNSVRILNVMHDQLEGREEYLI